MRIMNELKSCGFIVFRRQPELSFLLMKHANRWDLPKGHVDPGENELECALRELEEESGITADDLKLDSRFRFTQRYEVRSKRTGGKPAPKTLVIFLACLVNDVSIFPTEHLDYEWFRWEPPQQIQQQTIDPLLSALAEHFTLPEDPFDGEAPRSLAD